MEGKRYRLAMLNIMAALMGLGEGAVRINPPRDRGTPAKLRRGKPGLMRRQKPRFNAKRYDFKNRRR